MKKKSIRIWLCCGGLALIAACSAVTPRTVHLQGLVTGEAGMNLYTDKEPGETQPLERSYETAPPVIPHSVAGLEIRRSVNDCLDCHLEGDELADGHIATKIPESHQLNEFSGGRAEEGVVGVRYNCLQCHVPQADVPAFFSSNKAEK